MKTAMVIILVISIICLIVSLYLLINSSIKARRNKKDIPDWNNMTVQEVVDTLNEPQKTALYFLVSKAAEEARQEKMHTMAGDARCSKSEETETALKEE